MDVRKSFHDELEAVRADIVHLGGVVLETIPRGTAALLANDLPAARQIIAGDDAIDLAALELEERCYQLLALQQPMASDLRAVVTALWLTAEVERTADLMSNIAKATHRLKHNEIPPKLKGFIEQMGEEAARLVRMAIDAYVESSAELARVLDDVDDRLDDLHGDYIKAILRAAPQTDEDTQSVVQLALVGRYYERIGDHAVNMGERIQYMVTGWMPENAGAERARRLAEEGAPATAADGGASEPGPAG